MEGNDEMVRVHSLAIREIYDSSGMKVIYKMIMDNIEEAKSALLSSSSLEYVKYLQGQAVALSRLWRTIEELYNEGEEE